MAGKGSGKNKERRAGLQDGGEGSGQAELSAEPKPNDVRAGGGKGAAKGQPAGPATAKGKPKAKNRTFMGSPVAGPAITWQCNPGRSAPTQFSLALGLFRISNLNVVAC